MAAEPTHARAPFEPVFEVITPDRALQLLSTRTDNTYVTPSGMPYRNRSVSHARVARYAEDMENGYWEPTHQGIAIDDHGRLIDGQHRLLAVVLSDKPCLFLVCYGVNTDLFWLIDGGWNRSAQSFLEGSYRIQRAALSRTLIRLEELGGVADASIASGKYATHKVLRYLEEHPDVREYGEAYSRAASSESARRFKGTSGVGLLLGGYVAGPKRHQNWWEDVHSMGTGAGLPEGNPVRALFQTSPSGGNLTNINYLRALYAAVRYRNGKTLSRINAGNYNTVNVGPC